MRRVRRARATCSSSFICSNNSVREVAAGCSGFPFWLIIHHGRIARPPCPKPAHYGTTTPATVARRRRCLDSNAIAPEFRNAVALLTT